MGEIVQFPLTQARGSKRSSVEQLRCQCEDARQDLLRGVAKLQVLALERAAPCPSELIDELTSISDELHAVDVTLPQAHHLVRAINARTTVLLMATAEWLTASRNRPADLPRHPPNAA